MVDIDVCTAILYLELYEEDPAAKTKAKWETQVVFDSGLGLFFLWRRNLGLAFFPMLKEAESPL